VWLLFGANADMHFAVALAVYHHPMPGAKFA
jgi:hypothetical protein